MKNLLVYSLFCALLLTGPPSAAQTTTSTGTGTATSTAGNSTNTNTINVGGGSSTPASSSTLTGGSNSYFSAAQRRNPVATALAPPLTAADDTCMGSSSAGGQAVGFGLSVGSTWHDDDCVRRKDARELYNMGYKKASLALMCQSKQIEKAMKKAGTPCVPDVVELQKYEVQKYPGEKRSFHH